MSNSSPECREYLFANTETITHPRTKTQVPGLRLLRTGDVMPQVGLGTFLAEPGVVEHIVKSVLSDMDYLHIDTAWIYGNEDEVGTGLVDSIASGKIQRDQVWITTKLWNNSHAPEDVEAQCLEQMKSLKVDYLDLFLIHFPVAFVKDVKVATLSTHIADIDIRETWKAMEKLVDSGKVKNIGISNFEINQMQHLMNMPGLKYVPQVNQIECHPYYQRNDIVRFCMQRGIAVTAHSSLGGSGNPWVSQHKYKLLDDPVVTKIATDLGKSNGQVLLRWALQRGISVIPKSVNADRLKQNTDIFNFNISQDDMVALNGLDRGDSGKVCHPSTPWYGMALFADELEAMKLLEKPKL